MIRRFACKPTCRLKYVEKNNENWWKDTCDKFPSRNNHLEAAENKNLSKKIISQGKILFFSFPTRNVRKDIYDMVF